LSHVLFAYQAVPAAQNGATVAAPGPSPAAPTDPGAFGSWGMMLMFLPMLLLIFWQNRSQQKKAESAVAELKKGDRCVTQSGLVGRLIEIDNRYAKLELAPNVKVTVLRSSLSGRDLEDSAKTTPEPSKDEQK
jgi:preprotein translocase subunit YajC